MVKFKFFIGLFFINAVLLAQPLADGQEKFFGNIINDGSKIPANFLNLWNQVTPENAGKWGSAEPIQDNMNWVNLDKIYQFAKKNNLPFRQHAFVWGQQQPGWLGNIKADLQREEVEEWIRLFGERYPDADFIDVVNEPLHENPVYKDAIGGNGQTGWDWVIWSFEKAREHNPNAKLHINEYGVLNGWVSVTSYIKIINLLKERNLIDGIGLQGHFLESTTKGTITAKLNQLAQTGLPIYITEYDVKLADDAQHLAKYKEQVPAIYEHPAVAGMTLWGYMEGQMWRAEGFLIYRNGAERPAMTWLRDYFAGTSTVQTSEENLPDFQLEQNFPNPFNPTTTISFTLAKKSSIRLCLYNVLGEKVRILAEGEYNAGQHSLLLDAAELPTGLYLYKLEADGFVEVKKMALVR
jgi:endo-1,4-beta-xylanase